MGFGSEGKKNIVVGLAALLGFMLYGFILIYLRDFAPGKEEWVASYGSGKHFEARLSHVHGNLFAMLNILIGLLLMHMKSPLKSARAASWFGVLGMLMPIGIFMEVYLGTSPVPVIIGGISMVLSIVSALVMVVATKTAASSGRALHL